MPAASPHTTNGTDVSTASPLVGSNSLPTPVANALNSFLSNDNGVPRTVTSNGVSPDTKAEVTECDVLIIGTGPAGASLASFLCSYGIKGIMVSAASASADTPRAHITNVAALEALRDIGLEPELKGLATSGDCMMHTRWCHSMAGEEYARIYSWGNDPARKGDYATASPCEPVDLPQTLLEPALVKYASTHGFKCRFDTSFISFVDNGPKGVVTTLSDMISGKEYKIHSRYLFGADGARSKIVKQLALPLIAQPGGGLAINVLVKADLSHLIKHRMGNLHWIMQPESPHCDIGWMGIVRMVKPWHEWMFIMFPKPGYEGPRPTEAEYLVQVKNFIGDDSIPAEIMSISGWTINDIIAERYSEGNVFCLGDAVHRHPPFNGLGSNTCVQDAFNLAWKVAYTMKGLAPQKLLSTYSIERQPVGQSVVSRANSAFREHFLIWETLGMLPDDQDERKAIFAELSAPTPEGQARRALLQDAVTGTAHEFHGLGIEMNQFYKGPGVYTDDEAEPFKLQGPAVEDPVLHYFRSTYPGKRLPHAWLNKRIPEEPISTVDLAGKGSFALLTGIGGDAWRSAAAVIKEKLGIPVNVHSIGFHQDWVDVYSDWARLRGVNESGAVLVRPDRFVAWRCPDVLASEAECADKLMHVLARVLGIADPM